MPPAQYVHNVAQSRSLERSHNADCLRQRWDRFFAFCREQTLCLKFCLQLLKRDLQSPGALWFQVLSRDLQFASVFINRHSPSGYNLHPVFWTKSQEPRRRPEHHDPNLRVLILESEIKMSRVVASKIG